MATRRFIPGGLYQDFIEGWRLGGLYQEVYTRRVISGLHWMIIPGGTDEHYMRGQGRTSVTLEDYIGGLQCLMVLMALNCSGLALGTALEDCIGGLQCPMVLRALNCSA